MNFLTTILKDVLMTSGVMMISKPAKGEKRWSKQEKNHAAFGKIGFAHTRCQVN